MRKAVLVSLIVVVAALMLASMVGAYSEIQTEVQTVCGTSYSCNTCHSNYKSIYLSSGACGICPNDPDCGGGCIDNDGDSYCADEDCDDNNPLINPGVRETARRCIDRVDNNCNGLIDCQDPSCAKVRGCKPPR